MLSLDHPSLPKKQPTTSKRRPFSKPGGELILKALDKDPKVPGKYKKKWKAGNEERMLLALERFGHLQLRVKFELLEESGEDKDRAGYKTLAGKTLVFKRIETQGCLLAIIDSLVQAGISEAKQWTEKRK